MKGIRKRKKTLFQKGHQYHPPKAFRGKSPLVSRKIVPFRRLTQSEMEDVLQCPFPMMQSTVKASKDNPSLNIRFLRPKPDSNNDTSRNLSQTEGIRCEDKTRRIIQVDKATTMWNETFKEHLKQSHRCIGNLMWDPEAEIQKSLAWTEVMMCNKCKYRSKKYKLYEELPTDEPHRGRKVAAINKGIHVGMSQTPIGPTSLRKLLLSANIPPPSRSSLQKTANKVCQEITASNIKDMKRRRGNLKEINKMRGNPENIINVECDAAYNNKLYSGAANTPFQPATQCNFIIAENVTAKRQVIAVENVNKLCSKHGMHTGKDPKCDIKSGKCSKTDIMENSIGNEKEWATRCLLDMKNDDLEVKYMTTDGDSKAFMGALELYYTKDTDTEPIHLLDTRHQTNNHRKYISNCKKLCDIMPAEKKSDREKQCNNFASDLSKRCQLEIEELLKVSHGNLSAVKKNIPTLIDVIINCYSDDHGDCRLYSKVCDGSEHSKWPQQSAYLEPGFQIPRTRQSSDILKECILYRLNDRILEKTQFNTNSQKVEAVNRVLRRSVPTNVTNPRNFAGRSHSAVHSVNNGPGESLKKLLKDVGCPGTRVAKQLKKEQENAIKRKEYHKSAKAKLRRVRRRQKLYDLYRQRREQRDYLSAQLMNEEHERRQKTTKARKNMQQDHCYTAPSTSKK